MFWHGVSHAAEGDPSATDGLYGLLVARAHVPLGQGQRARCHRGDRQGLRNIEEPPDEGGASTRPCGIRGDGARQGWRSTPGAAAAGRRARRRRAIHRTRHGAGALFRSGWRILRDFSELRAALSTALDTFHSTLDGDCGYPPPVSRRTRPPHHERKKNRFRYRNCGTVDWQQAV
jgi:hypothetical protein